MLHKPTLWAEGPCPDQLWLLRRGKGRQVSALMVSLPRSPIACTRLPLRDAHELGTETHQPLHEQADLKTAPLKLSLDSDQEPMAPEAAE